MVLCHVAVGQTPVYYYCDLIVAQMGWELSSATAPTVTRDDPNSAQTAFSLCLSFTFLSSSHFLVFNFFFIEFSRIFFPFFIFPFLLYYFLYAISYFHLFSLLFYTIYYKLFILIKIIKIIFLIFIINTYINIYLYKLFSNLCITQKKKILIWNYTFVVTHVSMGWFVWAQTHINMACLGPTLPLCIPYITCSFSSYGYWVN